MNLETRRFILGLIMFFFFGAMALVGYSLTFTKGYTPGLVFSMVGCLCFTVVGFFIVIKNTNYF